ncbi:protein serine/threonine phosphatase 2C [Coccomyxa subellipsoidea C-169]|uniref:Protein serine/threonine phosphatase 2C n=1 Tax=Coccomyxa subellipsoidea (strain C-169) TaxID=574566 RepID=I0Z621_COCSC|nr:protein serine/threonine phosphatase 2C [Coccomyxa subellipsoidea C-169]EIE26090.1 protein serine/threonine phosphatase 2C [Coccomyxa subellipsoidea C-169]|eukprot:XP_005650634.1 protein serine/threonine phosphatase 2C [Coccomyxa subellipsoidea C-169]
MSEGRSSIESATMPDGAQAASLGGAAAADPLHGGPGTGVLAMGLPAIPPTLDIFYGAAEDRSSRDYMQDRHTIVSELLPDSSEPWAASLASIEPRSFAAVYDGHKRSESAETARHRLHALLAKEPAVFGMQGQSARDEVFGAIKRAFLTLDDEILTQAHESGCADCQFGGTTALMALRIGHVLYLAHVGDSGAVMVCTAYDLHFPLRLTTDHKPNRPDEHARIAGAGGAIDERHNRVVSEPKPHNGRVTLLSMSRCLGDAPFKADGKEVVDCTPEMRRIELQPGDSAVVLATDGLWDVMSDTDVVSIVTKVRGELGTIDDGAAARVAQALVDESLRKGTRDNITALVLLNTWS